MAVSHTSAKDLQCPIQFIRGVGPRLAERFAGRQIRTVEDALFLFPRRYEDRRGSGSISSLPIGEKSCFVARVIDFGTRQIRAYKQVFEMLLADDSGKIFGVWFHFHPTAFTRFGKGDWVRVAGKVEVYHGRRQIVHPEMEKLAPANDPTIQSEMLEESEDGQLGGVVPIYPEIEGIYPRIIRKIMREVVEKYAEKVEDILPRAIRDKYGFPSVADALRLVHFPQVATDLLALQTYQTLAQRRLIFEEFFVLQLGLSLRRCEWKNRRLAASPLQGDLQALARRLFGFDLTRAQQRVLAEILADMSTSSPMNRLLQGDVGSGKTAVAILAACVAARAGNQSALMAPTEILAEQHHKNIQKLICRSEEPLGVAFLSSAIKGAARKETLERIGRGEVHLVVGTHALIEDEVRFARLGLCIVDEQHRFGVLQRARLRDKGETPHVLVMTATPIPRTLAMTVYGDLDVSILDEMPPGRSPVKTILLDGGQVKTAYQAVRREVAQGAQAFLVYPLVEESEKMDLLDATRMFQQLQAHDLQGLRLGLLHGRMSPDEKDAVMSRFSSRELDVLVSTTVVEVGVDVPNATTMVIEHAERFGLSQLHQLRGRVGRGSRPSSCYLVAHRLSEDARRRLQILEKTHDGFLIAEEDLALRGPGEFLGTKQSGLPVFQLGDLVRDHEVLEKAREEAFALVQRGGLTTSPEWGPLKRALLQRWGEKLQLADVG